MTAVNNIPPHPHWPVLNFGSLLDMMDQESEERSKKKKQVTDPFENDYEDGWFNEQEF